MVKKANKPTRKDVNQIAANVVEQATKGKAPEKPRRPKTVKPAKRR